MHICQITSVHPTFDPRVFSRGCVGLVNAGVEVTLIAQHDKDEVVQGVNIISCKVEQTGRKGRLAAAFRALKIAMRIKADIFHFHDPDLMPFMIVLKLSGRKVVMDIHENYASRFYEWNVPLKGFLAKSFSSFENRCARIIDGISVESDKYSITSVKPPNRTVITRNVPDIKQLGDIECGKNKRYTIITAGYHSPPRHVMETIEAIPAVKRKYNEVLFQFIGKFDEVEFENAVKQRVKELGVEENIEIMPMGDVRDTHHRMLQGHVALLLLAPLKNYINSEPNRLFAAMYAKMAIVCENFPGPGDIIKETDSGILINSTKIEEISNGILELLDDPERMARMGDSGLNAIETKYNNGHNTDAQIKMYQDILGTK